MKAAKSQSHFRLGSVSSLADLVGDLKKTVNARLTRQFRTQLPSALVRRAVDEAELLARATGFPHLFLPELAAEQVRRIHASIAHDESETAFPAPRNLTKPKTMNQHTINVTEATFDAQVLRADKPVLVDLWAPWCGPCVQLSPLLDAVAAENAGRFTVAKINIDENPQLAANFGVRSIPTLLFFKDGTLRDQLLGGAPKRVLVEKLTALETAASLN